MNSSKLRHVVLLSFKDTSKPVEIEAVERAFCDLPNRIDEIEAFEWGTDVSVENLAQGYTHCFFLTFASAEDRDRYLPHPAHKAFGGLADLHLNRVLVIDYWTDSV